MGDVFSLCRGVQLHLHPTSSASRHRGDFKKLPSWLNGLKAYPMKSLVETSLLLKKRGICKSSCTSWLLWNRRESNMTLNARRDLTRGCLILSHQGISQGDKQLVLPVKASLGMYSLQHFADKIKVPAKLEILPHLVAFQDLIFIQNRTSSFLQESLTLSINHKGNGQD